jgi:hypothetical protein
MHWTLYPTSLHGSLSPAEISSCLWVGNQWQMQIIPHKLTMVNEHKAPQIPSQLYLLLVYHLYLFGVSVTDIFTISSLWCICHWKKILFLYCLISLLFFSLTNIIFSAILINANKCIPGTICNITILHPGVTRK